MDVSLAIVAPPGLQRTLSAPLPIIVGRGPESALRIQQESVSRRHCEIFSTDGKVYLRDLGSTNGTRIDGQRLTASVAVEVPPGTVARIGDVAIRIEFTPAKAAEMTELPAMPAMPAMPEPPQDAPDLADDLGIPDLEPAEVPDLPAPAPSLADLGTVTEQVESAADAFELPGEPPVEETADAGASFDFLGGADQPAPRKDASLDDFLKGLP